MFHHAAHGNVRNNIGDKAEGHQHGQQVARAEFDGIALGKKRFGRDFDQAEVLRLSDKYPLFYQAYLLQEDGFCASTHLLQGTYLRSY